MLLPERPSYAGSGSIENKSSFSLSFPVDSLTSLQAEPVFLKHIVTVS